jgi:hypothetical protein
MNRWKRRSGELVAHQPSHPLRLPNARWIGLEFPHVRLDVQHRRAVNRVQRFTFSFRSSTSSSSQTETASLFGRLSLVGRDSDAGPLRIPARVVGAGDDAVIGNQVEAIDHQNVKRNR